MWILKKITHVLVLFVLVSTGNCRSVDEYHRYAPSHEYTNTDYSYSYGVKDTHTGDIKHQWEKKEGDVVKGHYSVVEPDGRIRTVDYTADSKSGFNAIVKHKGHAFHPDTKATSHSQVKLSPPAEQEESVHYLSEPPKIATHFESSHGFVPEIKLNDGEHYQFSTESGLVASTESNEVAPVKSSFIYIPREGPRKEVKNKFKPFVPKVQYQVPQELPDTKVQYQVPQELPVDLSLLKQGQKVLPVDVSLINPIEIDLSQQPQETQQKELSQEELKKFLNDYYKGAYDFSGEEEFRPVAKPPQARKTNQKPATTPGLGSFSTQPGYSYPKPSYDRRNSVRPVQFPMVEEQPSKRTIKRLANTRNVRYAKTVTYHEEEK